MARKCEVLLTQDVLKLGNMGDMLRVAPGYARNYLYPFALAIPAGQAAKRQVEVLRERSVKSEADREAKATVLKKTIEGLTVQIAARVAHDTDLFGSIGTKEIIAALAKSGIEIDSKQVHLHDKLKRLGRYPVEVRLHRKIAVMVTVEVVDSDPNAPSLDETLAAARKGAKDETGAPAGATEEAAAAAPAKGAPGAKAVVGAKAAPAAPPAAPTTTKRAEIKIKNLGPARTDTPKAADAAPTAPATAKPAAGKAHGKPSKNG